MGTMKEYGSMGLATAEALLFVALAGPAAGQVTSRASVDSGGMEGNNGSQNPSVSAAGRFVAFQAVATNLVGGDTNGVWDVFVHDQQSGITERVSVSSGEAQGNDESFYPSISADGRYVAFESDATTLVGGDTNGTADVFVRDRQLGTTERVSVSSSGAQANGFGSSYPSISVDGRYVAFSSSASNLVGGDSNGTTSDVFVHDRLTGITELVSLSSSGAQGNDSSYVASISADARYVAFTSYASNLVGGDTNGDADSFVHDRQSGTTVRVSVRSNGSQANGSSQVPRISADGRYVAFMSYASNLVGGDTNSASDVFVHDRLSGTTERASSGSGGVEANNASETPSISADGRYVAFHSYASNLVSGDTNSRVDVFVRDRLNGTTERVSLTSGGAQGNHDSSSASITPDGRYVSFYSAANNLVSGDTNNVVDVFVRDRSTVIASKYCIANANSTGAPADLSASGSASPGAGDLTLTSSPVPNQNGIFFHGLNQSQNPFGNGFMCTTGGITRGAVIGAVGNIATYTYNNSDAKHSMAGFVNATRNFQYWFRDPMGGGAFFNTSNAVSIAILP